MTGSELSLFGFDACFASIAENVCFGAFPGNSINPGRDWLPVEKLSSPLFRRFLISRVPAAGNDLLTTTSSPRTSGKMRRLP